jgi:hypothetical protein
VLVSVETDFGHWTLDIGLFLWNIGHWTLDIGLSF